MKVGNIATGADFWGRQNELDELWRYLETEHISFPGVRRLGKSSILERMREDAESHGMLAKRIDLSPICSVQDFIDTLEREFPENAIKQFLSNCVSKGSAYLHRIRKVEVKLANNGGSIELNPTPATPPSWQAKAQKLHARLHIKPLLILLDEFPIMLAAILQRDPQEATHLLAWLRFWRQSTGNVCRFVFTGSIGLHSLLEQYGLSTFMNDCHTYHLGPFKRQEAHDLWQHFAPLTDGIPWQISNAVVEYALDRVDWFSPYFICVLLDETLRAARERQQESPQESSEMRIEQEDVDAAYEKLLSDRSCFNHWKTRLKETLPRNDLEFCWALLTAVSGKPEGLTLEQLIARLGRHEEDPERRAERIHTLLITLNDEGYLSRPDAQKRVQFLSFPLRDWWNRNHV